MRRSPDIRVRDVGMVVGTVAELVNVERTGIPSRCPDGPVSMIIRLE